MEHSRIVAITNTFVGTAVEEMNKNHISRIDQIKALACLRSDEFLNSDHKLNRDELINSVQTALIDTEIMDYLEPLHTSNLKAFQGANINQAADILNLFNEQLIKAIEDIAKTEILVIEKSNLCSDLKEQEIKRICLLTDVARNTTPYTVNDLIFARQLKLKQKTMCTNIFSVMVALVVSGLILFHIDPDAHPENSEWTKLIWPLSLMMTLTTTFFVTANLTMRLLQMLDYCIHQISLVSRRGNLRQFDLFRSDITAKLGGVTIKRYSEEEDVLSTTIETPLLNTSQRVRHP